MFVDIFYYFLKTITDTICALIEVVMLKTRNIFLLSYNLYRDQRIELFQTVSQYCIASLHVFLHGGESLSSETNQVIFSSCLQVHTG